MTLRAVLLAAVLVLGGVGTTIVRAHTASLTPVELCGIHGLTTVLLDAQGNPAGPAPACPDCIAAVAALPDATGITGALPGPSRATRAVQSDVGPVVARLCLPPARGPPPSA